MLQPNFMLLIDFIQFMQTLTWMHFVILCVDNVENRMQAVRTLYTVQCTVGYGIFFQRNKKNKSKVVI